MSQSLFIGGVSRSTTEQALAEYISTVAPVDSVEIPTDRVTKKAKGFAFVNMASEEGAQRVIAELHEQQFNGRSLYISMAHSKEEQQTEPCKLYVSGFADSTTNEALTEHLSAGGLVNHVAIATSSNTNESRGFAFVYTATEQDADSVIAACNGSLLDGKEILVRKSRLKKSPHSSHRKR